MPRDNDWGETLIALNAVEQYRQAGLKYGLLENYGTVEEPWLYTHNVNIGNLFYVVLDGLGVTSLVGKQTFTLLIFSGGMFLVYLCVATYSKSNLTAILVLSLFCLDYRNVLSFGYNALRAWHWTALFGMLYFGRNWQEGPRRCVRWLPLLAVCFIAFGCGYDFYLILHCPPCVVCFFSPAMTGKERGRGSVHSAAEIC